MDAKSFIQLMTYVEPVLCVGAIVFLLRAKQVRNYLPLFALLTTKVLFTGFLQTLIYMGNQGFNKHKIYPVYFYGYWISYTIESLLMLAVIYRVYKLAMEPLKGLQSLGLLVFRWAAAISLTVAIGMAFSPHQSSARFIINAVSQLQRTQSILTLCLLLFVTFAVSPMGLSYRSRVFGVCVGLGLLSTNNLIQSAWHIQNKALYSAVSISNDIVICGTILLWAAYFALPEPKRRMIVLPTTSPFLKWNQISIALGSSPGYVAVGGGNTDLFAPAELEVMRRVAKAPAPSAIAN